MNNFQMISIANGVIKKIIIVYNVLFHISIFQPKNAHHQLKKFPIVYPIIKVVYVLVVK